MCADDGTRAAVQPRPPDNDVSAETTSGNGKVTVAELIEHGLNRQPAYIAGVWLPEVRALLCRSHVKTPVLQRLGVDVDKPTSGALLMTGGRTTEQALGMWCRACRGDIEAEDEAAVVTLYASDDLEVRS